MPAATMPFRMPILPCVRTGCPPSLPHLTGPNGIDHTGDWQLRRRLQETPLREAVPGILQSLKGDVVAD